jgi:hypothetical protein
MSSGPDKLKGTGDDLVAGVWERNYFAPVQYLIEKALKERDYPATILEFDKLLSENGLLLGALKDPWGTAYKAVVDAQGPRRNIKIISAGPDGKFDTYDDSEVANFSGQYFRKESDQIAAALRHASAVPKTTEEFIGFLDKAGVDFSRYRDVWDRHYVVKSEISSKYQDRIETAQAVTATYIIFSIVSLGPDGRENLDQYRDDFGVASFEFLLKEETSRRESIETKNDVAPLAGKVTDRQGSIVQGCSIVLIDNDGRFQKTATDKTGRFSFVSIRAGIYSVVAAKVGFTQRYILGIQIAEGKSKEIVITLDHALNKTDVVEVNIQAADPTYTLMPAEPRGPSATPRVRDYFPETLLWLPEIITDASGKAQVQFPLADTVTTWKIAVIASTMDGRMAEAENLSRTYQPFFIDFNPPQVLTEGDQIELPVVLRNYQNHPKQVRVSLGQNEWSTVQGDAIKQANVPANGSVNTSFVIRAKKALEKAAQRIVADAGGDRDAIEKSMRIHPDGQEITNIYGSYISEPASINVSIPLAAIRGAWSSELRLYPNVSSLLLESAAVILQTPHGCAEQTISAGYANLLAWRFAHAAGVQDAQVEKRAMANVRMAVEALGRFKEDSFGTGIRYWEMGAPDAAVTAYALGFLLEAGTVVQVDNSDLASLIVFLEKNQDKDGMWKPARLSYTNQEALLLTSSVARSLAAAQKAGYQVKSGVLGGAYHHMAKLADSLDEPYMLANFILAALDSGDEALLGDAVKRLAAMGREEQGGIYWDLQTNSPFYGWGTAGRYETTGLAVSALSAWHATHPESKELDGPIRGGLVFLMRGRDRAGSWHSTQSTLRAMRAFVDASQAQGIGGKDGTLMISAKGRLVKEIKMPDDPKATDPIIIDLSTFLSSSDNFITLKPSAGMQSPMFLLSTTYWLPWEQTKPRTSPELRLNVQFDRLEARVGELVRCSVKAERVGFRGYGMMLAEIGLPPGAEVDRASLDSVISNGALGANRYEVLPDRVVFYLWPTAGGSSFSFNLSARMPMKAKSDPSILYDYYNPEALSEISPFQWSIK